ncbi:hypothetical protein EsDP_00006415 [Epichloe bromicola]|uniref:Uncharacterized protein n=1 Tax=Epichloe bromicola TaxID=79588 RepID=A0ABQ0CXL6_9HYPO
MAATAVSTHPHLANETRAPSSSYSDDHIYPVHLLDGAKYQQCILTMFIRFNDVLDPGKIKESISQLLSIGDWRKLGGRFRTKASKYPKGSKLEIHVPQRFTAARPAFQFAHEEFESSISEHPLGRDLPDAQGDEVSLSPPLDHLRRCGLGPGFPTVMADLIDRDAPQLCFKIISFNDATVFANTFSHCTWDISGVKAFMGSLQLVLDGREDDVPPMLGASSDILAEIADQHKRCALDTEPLLQTSIERKEGDESPPQDPLLEERIIRIPLATLERLRGVVAKEDPMEDDETFMNCQTDELLMALTVKQIAKAQLRPRPLKLLNIYNARLVIPRIAKAKGIYGQNLVLLSPQFLPQEVATGSMAQIIYSQRECFAQSAVPDNVARSLQVVLGAIKADLDITALRDNGEAEPLLINNLVRLSTNIDVDLSSAVVRQGRSSQTRMNGLGTPDFCYLTLPNNTYGMMRVTTLGSYNGDGCWMFGELPSRAWELIYEAALEETAG